MTGQVRRLRRVDVVVADLDRMERFYRERLGFTRVSVHTQGGAAYSQLLGLQDARSTTRVLRLGQDELALTCFAPTGRGYPAESTPADLWFQHIAVVVQDAKAAYACVRDDPGMTAISTHGPELLPPNTGSVTVFKFRDPEGHPVELSQLPPGVGAARWHRGGTDSPWLGIDHSAISVADVPRSIAFYRDVLGMELTFQSVNRGSEQDRLDGWRSDGVDIVALAPSDAQSPHIELLGYHPPGRRDAARANDIAATKLWLQTADLSKAVERLRSARATFVSPGVVTLESGEALVLVLDPDGHQLVLS